MFLRSVPFRWHVPWNERVFSYLISSAMGNMISISQAVLSLISCILFVIETYVAPLDSCKSPPVWFMVLEFCIQPMFVGHYLLLLALHHRTWAYVTSLPALVDKITVLPVYLDLCNVILALNLSRVKPPQPMLSSPVVWELASAPGNDLPSGFIAFGFFRILRAVRVARLLRLIKNAQGISIGGEMNAHVREAHRLISSIVTTVFLLVVMNTGLIQYVSSFTEVGGFYVSLEGTTAQLVEFNSRRSKFRGQYLAPDRHIVVCCDPECTGVDLFLSEFLHPDHGVSNIHVRLDPRLFVPITF
ncbi:MAG: hypothetical protein SGPRY_007037 [Prymnesium sp.]